MPLITPMKKEEELSSHKESMDIGLQINRFVWNVVDSNSWLIVEGKNGLLIDVVDNDSLFDRVRCLDSLTVILTHSHFDHISGLNRLREEKPESFVISTSLCSENIGDPRKNTSNIATAYLSFLEKTEKPNTAIEPFSCKPSDKVFTDNSVFDWCGHNVKLFSLHGHSSDSLAVIIDDQALFSGDELLSIPVITRLPGGSTEKYWTEDMPWFESIKNDITLVFPGHGQPGKIEDMIKVNVMPEKFRHN